jgi:hypothetical protein
LAVRTTTNVDEVLEGHVALEVASLDRIYLHGYVPNLMVAAQVVRFVEHLGNVARPRREGGFDAAELKERWARTNECESTSSVTQEEAKFSRR